MEAELRMKMQYDSRALEQIEKPYINVLPNHPYEAYRKFDQQTLAVIRKTERVPLPHIRELILMYLLPEGGAPDIQESELLIEKIDCGNKSLQWQAQNGLIKYVMLEQQRLLKLTQVFEDYKARRDQLISRAVRKTKHNVQEDAEKFKSEVKLIEQEKNLKITNFLNRSKSLKKSGTFQNSQFTESVVYNGPAELAPAEQQELKQIEREANLKTVRHIQSQSEMNIRYQSQQQERLQNLRSLSCFLNEFEKALVLIASKLQISSLGEPTMVANENYFKTFSDKLSLFTARAKSFSQELLDYAFTWRMNLKRDKKDEKSKIGEFQESYNRFTADMQKQLYFLIPNILDNLDNDRVQLRKLSEYFTENYQSYLSSYYSIKEVQQYLSKQSYILQIIQNQRMALSAHLKKNFGLMVPFKKSHEYQQLASLAISREKPYLKTLMEQKISHLQQVIAYINYEHNILYKQACDGSPAVAGKIKKKLEEFRMFGAKYPELKAHLELSCQRLLEIVNH